MDARITPDPDILRGYITNLPLLLREGVIIGKECVYVKVSESQPLEKYL
jgi:hypothetical protein